MKNKKVPLGTKGRDLTQLSLHNWCPPQLSHIIKSGVVWGGGGAASTGQIRLTTFPLYLLGRDK